MTAKISITLDDEVLAFVDAQGNNRSKIINSFLAKTQKEKLEADLKAAYIDQNNDTEFWAEFDLWDTTIGDGIDEEA